MVTVEYQAPATLAEAVELLAGADKKARVLAGGTDLLVQLRDRVNDPHLIVDLKKIPGMTEARLDKDGLHLGPAMCCAELTARSDIKAVYPGFIEAAWLIGSTQVQGRASVGGNLCTASPAGDTIPAMLALGARCRILGPKGARSLAAEDFVEGVQKNALKKGEILESIFLPRPAPGSADAYLRFIPRTEMDIAAASAGVSLTLDEQGVCQAARVAIGAVAPTALLVPAAAEALIGSKLDDAVLEAAGKAASAAAKPITDKRGTVEFRTHVVGVLTRRSARIAGERAREARS